MEINQINLGFRMLMMMATVDGNYQLQEGALLIRFIDKYLDDKSLFDMDEQNRLLLEIPVGKHKEECMNYAKVFADISTEEDKLNLLYYAFEIIDKDYVITQQEESLFRGVADVFGIEVNQMFETLEGL